MSQPLVLAIEPDLRQAAIVKRIVREKALADVAVVDSRDAAIEAMRTCMPDVLLLSALMSPRDEDELIAHLKTLENAGHLQTHTIPQLASALGPGEERASKGLLSAFRRKKEPAPLAAGCDPDMFAEEIRMYLQRAADKKSQRQNTDFTAPDMRPSAVATSRAAAAPSSEQQAPATPSSSWSSPFEWKPSGSSRHSSPVPDAGPHAPPVHAPRAHAPEVTAAAEPAAAESPVVASPSPEPRAAAPVVEEQPAPPAAPELPQAAAPAEAPQKPVAAATPPAPVAPAPIAAKPASEPERPAPAPVAAKPAPEPERPAPVPVAAKPAPEPERPAPAPVAAKPAPEPKRPAPAPVAAKPAPEPVRLKPVADRAPRTAVGAPFQGLVNRHGHKDRDEMERFGAVAAWARSSEAPRAAKGAPVTSDDVRALISSLAVPAAVASVSYASGCRIRRVRVPVSPDADGGDGTAAALLSRRSPAEQRKQPSA